MCSAIVFIYWLLFPVLVCLCCDCAHSVSVTMWCVVGVCLLVRFDCMMFGEDGTAWWCVAVCVWWNVDMLTVFWIFICFVVAVVGYLFLFADLFLFQSGTGQLEVGKTWAGKATGCKGCDKYNGESVVTWCLCSWYCIQHTMLAVFVSSLVTWLPLYVVLLFMHYLCFLFHFSSTGFALHFGSSSRSGIETWRWHGFTFHCWVTDVHIYTLFYFFNFLPGLLVLSRTER